MVEFNVADHYLICETKPDLFSPKGLDSGTKLLLEVIAKKELDYQKALDWGCGWGAIGLWLAKNRPEANVIALDSDIAAVSATKQNATTNHIANLEVMASYSFDELSDQGFDIIVSNPPTHRGREVVEQMIVQAKKRLTSNGILMIVVEARLKPWVARQMKTVFGDYKIAKRGPKHVVLMASKMVE